jgi:hypothetical protein
VEQTSAREGFLEVNAVDTKPLTYTIVAEQDADITAREALLDAALGPKRRKKSSEKIRRGLPPPCGEGLGVGVLSLNLLSRLPLVSARRHPHP